jgi:hypothetical protein
LNPDPESPLGGYKASVPHKLPQSPWFYFWPLDILTGVYKVSLRPMVSLAQVLKALLLFWCLATFPGPHLWAGPSLLLSPHMQVTFLSTKVPSSLSFSTSVYPPPPFTPPEGTAAVQNYGTQRQRLTGLFCFYSVIYLPPDRERGPNSLLGNEKYLTVTVLSLFTQPCQPLVSGTYQEPQTHLSKLRTEVGREWTLESGNLGESCQLPF